MAAPNKYFTETLLAWMEAEGINAPKLCEILGCSRTAAYQYKDGRVPEWDILLRLAQEMGQPMEGLLEAQSSTGHARARKGRDWIRLPRREPLTTATRAAIEIALDVLQSGGEGGYDKILMQNIKSCKEGLDKQRKINEPLPEKVNAGGSKTG